MFMKLMLKIMFTMLFSGLILSVKINWWLFVGYLCLLLPVFLVSVSLEESFKMLGFNIYLDTLAFSLCYLSVWLTLLMMTSSIGVLRQSYSKSLFILLTLGLLLVLILSFTTNNYLLFYFFFEASLIPTLLIITGWGYQPERLQAGIYFMLYTLTASLPLLLSLFFMFFMLGSLSMDLVYLFIFMENSFIVLIFSVSLLMAFLVKMPLFMFHLWLPKAHVEAPVAGSMILAGVLLKLGGYGICRVFNKFYYGINWLSPYLISLSLLSMVYVGFMCCRLSDMKALVAYSSVAHMGLVLAGLMTNYVWGMLGGFMMMISHGLSSSGLFCIVNMYYERSSSRSLYVNSGLIVVLPILSLMMFMLCASNISAPPTINLLSEFFLMLSVLSYDTFMMLIFPMGSFMGAVFTLYLFSYSQHGSVYMILTNFSAINSVELHSLLMHLIPLNILILKSEVFFTWC